MIKTKKSEDYLYVNFKLKDVDPNISTQDLVEWIITNINTPSKNTPSCEGNSTDFTWAPEDLTISQGAAVYFP